MNIETVNDLAEQIADWVGIYGGCKNESSPDSDGVNGCTYNKSEPNKSSEYWVERQNRVKIFGYYGDDNIYTIVTATTI